MDQPSLRYIVAEADYDQRKITPNNTRLQNRKRRDVKEKLDQTFSELESILEESED